ncbi:hypothetical protein S225a_21350 [Candidatus Brocadiaceae bacterium S225]|nr:hypothetical protein S225a_21350 [Candidatus Brocadiaceae bacterium S225]
MLSSDLFNVNEDIILINLKPVYQNSTTWIVQEITASILVEIDGEEISSLLFDSLYF